MSSVIASAIRGYAGRVADNPRSEIPNAAELYLYEFEACPFCRKVREALTVLDLEVTVFPCPKGGERYRPGVAAAGGKAQFPYLVDRREGLELYESDEIIKHLAQHYGDGRVPLSLRLGPLTAVSASVASLVRGGAGTFARPARIPTEPLVLYAFEACVESRPVREALCVYELPYVLRSCGVGSRRRDHVVKTRGAGGTPLLEDPNTDRVISGGAAAERYLREAYAR